MTLFNQLTIFGSSLVLFRGYCAYGIQSKCVGKLPLIHVWQVIRKEILGSFQNEFDAFYLWNEQFGTSFHYKNETRTVT